MLAGNFLKLAFMLENFFRQLVGNVSVLDLHQLHEKLNLSNKVDLISSIFHVTDEGLRPKRFYFLLNFLTF